MSFWDPNWVSLSVIPRQEHRQEQQRNSVLGKVAPISPDVVDSGAARAIVYRLQNSGSFIIPFPPEIQRYSNLERGRDG